MDDAGLELSSCAAAGFALPLTCCRVHIAASLLVNESAYMCAAPRGHERDRWACRGARGCRGAGGHGDGGLKPPVSAPENLPAVPAIWPAEPWRGSSVGFVSSRWEDGLSVFLNPSIPCSEGWKVRISKTTNTRAGTVTNTLKLICTLLETGVLGRSCPLGLWGGKKRAFCRRQL